MIWTFLLSKVKITMCTLLDKPHCYDLDLPLVKSEDHYVHSIDKQHCYDLDLPLVTMCTLLDKPHCYDLDLPLVTSEDHYVHSIRQTTLL